MACTLFTRILYRARLSRRSPDSAVQTNTNTNRRANPHPRQKSSRSLSRITSAIMGSTEPKIETSAIIYAVPLWLESSLVENFLRSIPEIVQVHSRRTTYNSQRYDLLLDFNPGTDVFKALGTTQSDPYIVIDHNELHLNKITDKFGLKDFVSVAKTKRQIPPTETNQTIPDHELKFSQVYRGKLECHICTEEINGPFSTPCWDCKNAVCYECVRTHFRSAMKDYERFPARCCAHAFHPDVARGILADEEHAKYRLRFEEWVTKNPVYCPVPTCSAFIPARTVRWGRDRMSGFKCHTCAESLCVDCKDRLHLGEKCAPREQNTMEQLKKFGYKQCPKCRFAVGKMYGCSHVMCKCGAHWCWECRRKIEICNMSPCDGSYEGDEEDSDDWHDQGSDIDSIAESDATGRSAIVPPSRVEPDEPHMDGSPHPVTQVSTEQLFQDYTINEDYIGEASRAGTAVPGDVIVGQPRMDMEMTPVEPMIDAIAPNTPVLGDNETSEKTDTNDAEVHTDNLVNPVQVLADAVEINRAEAKTDTFVNLDDPNATAWQYENLNLGDEPDDYDSLDIWGCVHSFLPATYNKVPRYWLTASIPDWWERDLDAREVDCMVCWKAVKIAPKTKDIELLEDGEAKRRQIKDWRLARKCGKCNIIVCRRCRNDLVKSDDD